MIVDCGDCLVRDIACADCIVTVLLGTPSMPSSASGGPSDAPARIHIDQEELGAMGVLADVGLVPKLRLVVSGREGEEAAPLSARDRATDRRAI